MQKKLVILLSRQRSGTNALRSVLESHPKIHCFNEIMSYNPSDMAREDSYIAFARQKNADRYADPDQHIHIFDDFVQQLHQMHDKDVTLIDLKYNSCHHVSARWQGLNELPLFNWIQKKGVPVLRLRRNNYLKVLVSDEIANQRNQWHDSVGDKPAAVTTVIPNSSADMNFMMLRLKEHQLEDDIVSHAFSDYDNLCQVSYSEMFPQLGCPVSDNVLNRICGFLDLKFDFNPIPWSIKSVPRPIWEAIANWRQVKEHLTGTEFEHFLADEPMFQNHQKDNQGSVQLSSASELLNRIQLSEQAALEPACQASDPHLTDAS